MTAVTRPLPGKFDPRDPAVLADPYPTYAALREAGPLCRMGPGSFGVTRYADVARLSRDSRLGSQFPAEYHRVSTGPGAASEFFSQIILYRDPPEHPRLRRLIGKAFSPSLVRRFRPTIEAMVDELLAPGVAAGRFDAVDELAFALPVMVVCALMGIPASEYEVVRPYALDLSKAFAAHVSGDDRLAADRAVVWLRDYLGAALRERSGHPGDDLLSRLLAAEEDGETLSHQEIVDNAVFSFFAGFETSTNLIASGVAALLAAPEQWDRLSGNENLVPGAVEEFLRFDSPIQGVARLVRTDLEIGDRTVKAGRVLVLLLGSANHDPAQFDRPERLRIDRDPNLHLAFGGGAHTCLGAALARIEAEVAFRAVVRRFRTLEPDGPAVRHHGATLRGYAHLPVRGVPR